VSVADAPWSEASARARLLRLAPALPVRLDREPRFLPSFSNDAWDLGEAVLRVCWRGDRRRLAREARVGAALPREIGYPQVLGAGEFEAMTWTLTRRVDGVTLDEVWLDPDLGRVRAIIGDFADRLRRLHVWRPPAETAALFRAHADAPLDTAEEVTGHDVLPLPLSRSQLLLEPAKELDHVDPGVVDAAWARMLDLASFDPFAGPQDRIAHCDATYPNILVAGAGVSALLDFEWARLAPGWVELVAWVRLLEDLREEGLRLPPILTWLEDSYPAMFETPRLGERLWLYELAYTLRHIVFWPPDAPEDRLQRDHPLHRLRRLIGAPIPWA
jgi:hypothetical protein